MSFKLSKDSDESPQQEATGDKKSQKSLVVLLLILLAGFTYVYFFTALIKPQEGQKPAEATASATQVAKMPLPPRIIAPAKPEGKSTEEAEAPKAVTTPVKSAIPVAKPAAAPSMPASVPPKAKEEQKKAETPKPIDKRPLPDKKVIKAVAVTPEEKKAVVADVKGTSAKNSAKKSRSDEHAKPETVVKTKKAAKSPWLLVVGNYVLEETLSADMGRVRKAGLDPVVKPAARKKTTMNRLFISNFSDRATAQSTLEKLKRVTSDAFIIEQGGQFALYAGSYLESESAKSEKERLTAAGFSATLKHADISIPSQSLSVGPFESKKAADAALGKLKGAGLKATFSQN